MKEKEFACQQGIGEVIEAPALVSTYTFSPNRGTLIGHMVQARGVCHGIDQSQTYENNHLQKEEWCADGLACDFVAVVSSRNHKIQQPPAVTH
jgi:hypothetical protein